jgi:hypothetical protein
MDKKAKKRSEVIKKKRENLRQQLSVVKRFPDDPDEPARLEAEIAALTAELERLTKS